MDKSREVIIVKRKKHHGHGHHGGAWKVAFADFMTAMFAMFLVLWLVNQSSDVKAAVAGYFQDPMGSAREAGASAIPGQGGQVAPPSARPLIVLTEMRRQELQMLGEKIKEDISSSAEFKGLEDHLEVTVTDEGLRIQLLEDSSGVFFELGSATPKPAAAAFLRLIGAELGSLPNGVMVDGYTHARPYSAKGGYSNWELSADRANTSRRLLVEGGLSEAQLQGVRGHADRDLRSPDDPLAPSNRRVTITMLMRRLNEPASDSLARDTLAAVVPATPGRIAPAPAPMPPAIVPAPGVKP